jgi:hypothetical protein
VNTCFSLIHKKVKKIEGICIIKVKQIQIILERDENYKHKDQNKKEIKLVNLKCYLKIGILR